MFDFNVTNIGITKKTINCKRQLINCKFLVETLYIHGILNVFVSLLKKVYENTSIRTTKSPAVYLQHCTKHLL